MTANLAPSSLNGTAHPAQPSTPGTSATIMEDDITSPGPFEGPEKLLEVWFAPSADELPERDEDLAASFVARRDGAAGGLQVNGSGNGVASGSGSGSGSVNGNGLKHRTRHDGMKPENEYRGLRKVPREVWEEMLDIVKCKVLSVVQGEELDAYLLSESSLFVAPHLIILKTCGTTLNLLGLYRIIEIAREYCGFSTVWRCFYSRKSFFFPERQHGPHKDWRDEVNFLDSVFGTAGSAYTVGPMNRDHWLLYLTSPNAQPLLPSDSSLSSSFHLSLPSPPISSPSSSTTLSRSRIVYHDTTLEILMSHLTPAGREPFFQPNASNASGHELGVTISKQMGIDTLFSAEETVLDSFGFDPCGYSANAVVGSGLPGDDGKGGGYFTIHVTPEDGWSYASFECNVPLPSPSQSAQQVGTSPRPDLPTLIRRVVDIFQPNRLSITLFVSTPAPTANAATLAATAEVESQAWKAFRGDLLGKEFERKDRIGYEFEGYDLIFACFERKGWSEEQSLPAGGLAGLGKVTKALEGLAVNGDGTR